MDHQGKELGQMDTQEVQSKKKRMHKVREGFSLQTMEDYKASTHCNTPAVDKGYRIREPVVRSIGTKRLDLPVQKNILTNYFCLASLQAKRKFRAPKVTPKQQTLNESSLPSPQTEDSGTPDSVEDTSLPTNDIETSQCSSERFSPEPPPDDSINAPQCSAEHFGCAFPRDDSASVSPYCSSRDIGSDPPSEDQYLEDTEVEVSYCNASTIPISPCLERMSPGIADPLLVSYNTGPSRPVPHYAESTVAPTNRNSTVRSSYFNKVERVYTNQGEDQFDDDDNQEAGTSTLSGDQLRNPEGITKRRKLWDPQNFEDETLQPTISHGSLPVDEGCDAGSLDGMDTTSEGRFGCNVSHVNKYSGIAEKSMDKFAALISSFRYAGSRASGLRAPLKDVKNTLPMRSILRPPEQNLRCTAKKTARGHHAQSRSTSDAPKSTDSPPDLSTFAYRPNKTAAVLPDSGKITNKAAAPATSPPDLASCPDRSKFSTKVVRTADSPPDLSTFAYKAMKPVVRDRESDGSRITGTRLAASGRTSRGRFT